MPVSARSWRSPSLETRRRSLRMALEAFLSSHLSGRESRPAAAIRRVRVALSRWTDSAGSAASASSVSAARRMSSSVSRGAAMGFTGLLYQSGAPGFGEGPDPGGGEEREGEGEEQAVRHADAGGQ